MLDDLKEIIAIDSVYSEPRENAPFGEKPRKALDWFLDKCASYGFKTGELDGYCGWAEIGEGDELVGILCHLDVVPAGDDWTTPPFEMTIDGGKIYGRGVTDDKGPLVACVHALKDIKESGFPLTRRFRIIVGCNEENGSACMKHYAKHGEIPVVSIVPDADFPIINSEKGILHYLLKIPADDFIKENIIALEGGVKDNVVPDKATLKIKKNGPLYKYLSSLSPLNEQLLRTSPIVEALLTDGNELNDFSISDEESALIIGAKGVAGHAMEPEKGDNAVWKIFCFLNSLKDKFPSVAVETVYEYLCTLMSCEKLGFGCFDEESGDTTCNLGLIRLEGDKLNIDLNIRLPISCKKDDVSGLIIQKMPPKSTLKEILYSPNLFVEKDAPIVKTLLKVYAEQTGEKPYCVQSGGGTYAKELPNAVAFGPTFPETKTNIHNADECMPVVEFEKLFDVYRAAVIAIDRMAL